MEGETPCRYSMMALLLRNARKLAGRNIETGVYEMNEVNENNFVEQTYYSMQYTSLINYLILLEQIGSIFKPKEIDKIEKTNGIYCTLKYFSPLNQEKIDAIKALRNSLVHKFGLATEKKDKGAGSFKFLLSIKKNNKIVIPKYWSGDFSDKSDNTLTTIFIPSFEDLVEGIYSNIVQDWELSKLEILPEVTINEIKARYTIVED